MRLSLEQVFYGRGERGYCVLAMSPGASPWAGRVEALCGAVGMAGSDYAGDPFLLSVPEGDRVLMVCGRRGAPDSMGRETLFFHALVASRNDLAAAKADAFSLFARNVFAERPPSGKTASPLLVDTSGGTALDGRSKGALDRAGVPAFPCLVRSERPAPDTVRASVGSRILDVAWATFAFQPLDRFDVQVLSPRVPNPFGWAEYDASLNLLRPMRRVAGSAGSERAQAPHSGRGRAVDASPSRASSTLLKVSLFGNLVLAVACAALFSSRKEAPEPPVVERPPVVVTNVVERVVEKPAPASLSAADRDRIAREAQEEFRRKLAAGLPDKASDLQDYDKLPILQKLLNTLQTPIKP